MPGLFDPRLMGPAQRFQPMVPEMAGGLGAPVPAQQMGGLGGGGMSFMDRMRDLRDNNPEALLMIGSGLMKGDLGGGFAAAAETMGHVRAAKQKKADRNATRDWLLRQGLSEIDAEAALASPEIFNSMLKKAGMGGGDAPSSVREWEYFNGLSKEDQARYLRMKRANPYLDVGTGFVQPDPANPGTVAGAPIVKDNYREAYDTSLGGEDGKNRAAAGAALPGKITTADNAITLARDLLADPNLGSYVGAIQGRMPSITQGAVDFDAKVQQLRDMAFLDARQMLKGGGAITDFESQKAENAIARLNQAQSEEQFRAALTDFIDAAEQGKRKLEAAAAGQSQMPASGGSGVVDYRDYFGGQ